MIAAFEETPLSEAQSTSTISLSSTKQSGIHITQTVVDTLNSQGIVVIKNVLSANELAEARRDVFAIKDEGRFQLSTNESFVRRDKIVWLREDDGINDQVKPLGVGILRCISLLRGAAHPLEKLGYNRSVNHATPLDCQLSCYTNTEENNSTGAVIFPGYVAHRDAADSGWDRFMKTGLLGWYIQYTPFFFLLRLFLYTYNINLYQGFKKRTTAKGV
jgi:hypothetical protein